MKKKIFAVMLTVITLFLAGTTVSAAGSPEKSSKKTYTSPVTGKKITIPGKGLARVVVDGEKAKLIPAEHKVNKISESKPYDNVFYAYLDGYGLDFDISKQLYFALAEKPISTELMKCIDSNCNNGSCKECFYSGECFGCLGKGKQYNAIIGDYIKCSKCDGTGKCPACNGTGKCLTCKGEGKVSAPLTGVSAKKWKAGTAYDLSEMNQSACFARLRGYYKPTYSSNSIYTKDHADYFEDAQFKIIKRKGKDITWYFYIKTSYNGSNTHTFEGVARTVRGKGKGTVPGGDKENGGSSGGSSGGSHADLFCSFCGGTGSCGKCTFGSCSHCSGKGYVEVPTYGTGLSGRADCAHCVNGRCSTCGGTGKCTHCGGSGRQ